MSMLRNRLLASYLLLLLVSLGAIMVAFVAATSAQPAPPQPTYQRLIAVAQGLNLNNLVQEFGPLRQGRRETNLTQLLGSFAVTREVRVLGIDLTDSSVFYDSANQLTVGSRVPITADSYRVARSNMTLVPGNELVFGSLFSDADEWLFAGVTTPGRMNQSLALIVAEERPAQSLTRVLADFGSALARPLLQAAGIGMLVAVILAALISRTIARPLQAASNAATAVAHGDLNQYVPETGPREVRAVARAFNRMSARVRATQQAQRDFLANISHDLKTPLTSIQGYSQAIMDGTARDPQRAAAIIHDEAERVNRMVIELTDLVRMQAGQFTLNRMPLRLDQIVTNVSSKLAVLADQQGVRLNVEARPVPLISVDGDRMVQVLSNLIGNAIKFTPAGGQVWVTTASAPDGVTVSVRDTGDGIPESEIPRIFERFYQVDKVRGPARGMGLGLAIVNEIVRAHGGRVSVESPAGEGATFTVWLPLAAPQAVSSG